MLSVAALAVDRDQIGIRDGWGDTVDSLDRYGGAVNKDANVPVDVTRRDLVGVAVAGHNQLACIKECHNSHRRAPLG
jgi:hypothetical protein